MRKGGRYGRTRTDVPSPTRVVAAARKARARPALHVATVGALGIVRRDGEVVGHPQIGDRRRRIGEPGHRRDRLARRGGTHVAEHHAESHPSSSLLLWRVHVNGRVPRWPHTAQPGRHRLPARGRRWRGRVPDRGARRSVHQRRLAPVARQRVRGGDGGRAGGLVRRDRPLPPSARPADPAHRHHPDPAREADRGDRHHGGGGLASPPR